MVFFDTAKKEILQLSVKIESGNAAAIDLETFFKYNIRMVMISAYGKNKFVYM